MLPRTRPISVAVAVCAAAVVLAGCATTTPDTADSAPSSSATEQTPTPTTTGTGTVPESPTPTPSASTTASALAQHVYDECSSGTADAGVTLTFTPHPSGYTGADGNYQLVYPFTFDDGHTDPYAVWNCTLTDDTVGSSYVGGGLSDTH